MKTISEKKTETISRYYIFIPAKGKFISWNGKLVSFMGAKDFMTLDAAEEMTATVYENFGVYFIFKLVD